MQRDFAPTVYLLASKRNGTLYTGVTSDLLSRIHQHRMGTIFPFFNFCTEDFFGFRISGGALEKFTGDFT